MAKRPATGNAQLTRRQMSRAKREALLQRWIFIGAIVLAVAAVGVIGYGVLDQQYLQPNRAVVTVGDQKVTGSEFKTQVTVDAYLQLGGQIPLSAYGLDASSYAKIILDDTTNDLLVAQKAKELGVSVSDEEVEREVAVSFGYDGGTPVPTGTPTETMVPVVGSPTVTSTFVYTLTPSPTVTQDPAITATPTFTVTPTGAATSTPTVVGTATMTPSPFPTSTPLSLDGYTKSMTDFLATAAATTKLTQDQVKKAWYSRVRSGLLRQKVITALKLEADKQKTMLHAAHLLVASEDEAKQALARIKGGEAFEKVAAEVSTDTTNAYKGGDLGWFGPNVMDKDFEAAALKTAVGSISDPVQSQFGWHLIKVYDSKVEPTTGSEQQQQIQEKLTALFDQWKIDYKFVADDTTWQQFVPDIQ